MESPINRTILELKLDNFRFCTFLVLTINRTILELKQNKELFVQIGAGTINRTILELKQLCACQHVQPVDLLIEPFWN